MLKFIIKSKEMIILYLLLIFDFLIKNIMILIYNILYSC